MNKSARRGVLRSLGTAEPEGAWRRLSSFCGSQRERWSLSPTHFTLSSVTMACFME